MPSAAQIRGARAMLKWSMAKLAKQAGVSISTIKRFENDLPQHVTVETVLTMREALMQAGIGFLPDDGHGEGLRLNCQSVGVSPF